MKRALCTSNSMPALGKYFALVFMRFESAKFAYIGPRVPAKGRSHAGTTIYSALLLAYIGTSYNRATQYVSLPCLAYEYQSFFNSSDAHSLHSDG